MLAVGGGLGGNLGGDQDFCLPPGAGEDEEEEESRRLTFFLCYLQIGRFRSKRIFLQIGTNLFFAGSKVLYLMSKNF